MGVASGLSALSYILALLAAGALLTITGNFRLDGEQWCFSNPESINGPFITAKHWSLGSYGIAYITASVLREPGFQCTTIARAHLSENITFTGPATCRTLIPIPVHHYWNTVTIKQTDGTNCSSCMYSDVPVGGPWPQIPCAKLPPHTGEGVPGFLGFRIPWAA